MSGPASEHEAVAALGAAESGGQVYAGTSVRLKKASIVAKTGA